MRLLLRLRGGGGGLVVGVEEPEKNTSGKSLRVLCKARCKQEGGALLGVRYQIRGRSGAGLHPI